MTHVKQKKKKNSAINIIEKVKEELRKEKKKEQRDREVRQRDSEPLSPDADVTPSSSSVITSTRRDARLSPSTHTNVGAPSSRELSAVAVAGCSSLHTVCESTVLTGI